MRSALLQRERFNGGHTGPVEQRALHPALHHVVVIERAGRGEISQTQRLGGVDDLEDAPEGREDVHGGSPTVREGGGVRPG